MGAPPTYQPTESDHADFSSGVERHDRAVGRLPADLVDEQTGGGQNPTRLPPYGRQYASNAAAASASTSGSLQQVLCG